jgi:MFS family permease
MITQSFLYNAIFFTYTLILVDFYRVEKASVFYYIFPFALGNLLGPLLIGRFFDTVGRRKMISLTYCTSAVLLAISGWMFQQGMLTATTQTVMWCVIFFIASAAASSAYLTVSEIYPVEIRAQAISVIFAIAQSFGATAPPIFGFIIARAVNPDTHEVLSRTPLGLAYGGCAVVMFGGGLIAWFFGVDAEQKSLEDVAPPLSATETPHVTPTPAELPT